MDSNALFTAWVRVREEELSATLRHKETGATNVKLRLKSGVLDPDARYTAVAAIVISGVPEAKRQDAQRCLSRGEWSGLKVVFAE